MSEIVKELKKIEKTLMFLNGFFWGIVMSFLMYCFIYFLIN